MDATLLRINANRPETDVGAHVAEGITLFAKTPEFARAVEERLRFGWIVETKPVDCKHLHPLDRAKLIGPIWPQLPLAALVELLEREETAYEPAESQ
jgi:hypothetical protein